MTVGDKLLLCYRVVMFFYKLKLYIVSSISWACQYCGCTTSISCTIPVPYPSDFIYLLGSVFTEADKSCNLNKYLVWFHVVSKGNVFFLIKRAVWSCWRRATTQAHLAEEDTHLMIYPFFFFFFSSCLCQRMHSLLSTRVWRRRKNP